MFIKEIVLDGFKSYGQRTVISGFDTEFNAITGLNGTGKSNILDSICFVLGISNLSQVRAGSLQDLIYKSGQAGISKATVSITFDNRNKVQSPPGFEDYNEITVTRQVVMGGKNKYMLNGSVVQNKRIQDFFCSVQLNVNNPHFLIMQGRITKVLNMKPQEILAMVEEAAGTRMYETKRQAAQKTIEKKEMKLLELEKINQEEIAPKLNKLREERTAYLEYQRIERELGHMMTLFQTWQYLNSQKQNKHAEEALMRGQVVVKEIEDHISRNEAEAAKIASEVEEATKNLESQGGEKLREIETELKSREKSDAKADASEKSAYETINAEEKKVKQLQKNLKDDETALKKKEQELSKVQDIFQQLKEADTKDNEAFALSQKKYEAISVGMEVNDDGEVQTLQDQLMSAKQQATQANTEIKQSTMQLNHLQSQLKIKQKDLGSNAADCQKDQKSLETIEKEVNALEKSLNNMSYSEEKMNDLKLNRQAHVKEIRGLQEKVDRFQSTYPYTNFRYRDPETNFKRNSVKGLVCRLIRVKESTNCTALETVAGGRLYNVIVDTDVTSKKLLQRGNLQHRTTFIPLNKIQGGKIDQNTINFAQKLVGKENVQPALSLIEYDRQLQPAIEYVFGNTFVCKDLNIARQVTFHEKIMRRCVTIEGDVVDPSGTLSGGARLKTASVLLQLDELEKYEAQLKTKEKELVIIENEIQKMSGMQNQWFSIKQQYELKQHEVGLIKGRLQQTTHHLQMEEIENMKKTITELNEKVSRCKEIEAENSTKAKDLELKMKDSKGHRERLLKEAENEMKKLKKKADNSKKNWQQREQEYETLTLEISELKKGLLNIQEQINLTEANIVTLKEQYEELQAQSVERKKDLSELQKQYKAEKVTIAERNKELQKKLHKKEQLLTQVQELQLEIKKQHHEINKLQEEHKSSKRKVAEFERREYDSKHIKDAQELSDNSASDLEKRIRTLQEKRTKLSRTVNSKAQSMFDHEEKQYNQLLKKKSIVESDKRKLLLIMKDLDKKKVDAIMLAWKQVSEDFGSIFRTLLPGSNAKLQSPQGQTVLEGLEVKVFLGGVWKESLSELSGGQRSLVALSLILAMLLFKPAPLYILDEVDAALDLSHTQNIGNMLKSHFKQSQFIIVSLKDGMFNNANVLFRTKFVDGVSTVTRTVNRR